ncbi:MAG: leucine-rich repeat protein [Muribaculaceae bacterium]|nr:leucine-rich repeat protein [Muribaculaceae bacterium]
MNKKSLVLLVIALCVTTLPAKILANVLDSIPIAKIEKSLPYPKTTKVIPASAMEYDSIAQCFVVRDSIVVSDSIVLNDSIVGNDARTLSTMSVTTKAAYAYNEDGVLYEYFGDQLSSENMDEMKRLLESWDVQFKCLEIDSILSPAPGKETWYMQIVGVNNSDLNKNSGEMRIYNDIGTAYNYKTISIDSLGLRNNEYIKKVVFEDCASTSANANTRLKMVIHNGAFKGCKNLKEFNMYYLVTKGDNNYQMLYPWEVYIGDNVFDGCHEDFRIVVAPQLYNFFIVDDNWGKYADKIVASDYMPTVYNPIVHEGVTYDYAANSLNTLPTSELTRLQSSWWNAAIIGAEVAIAIATWGTASSATAAAVKAKEFAVKNAQMGLNAAKAGLVSAEETFKNAIKEAVKNGLTVSAQAKWKYSIALGYYEAKKQALQEALATTVVNNTYYAIAAGVSAATPAGINGLSYIANTIGQKAKRQQTWALEGQWLLTENKHTIYHMYVKDVENKETVTLYNDIGSAYNYKTVAIGRDAFRGKDKVKTLKFKDVNKGEMYASMTMVIPDSAFIGCSNLETVDLIMHSNYTNRDVALGPENFILCGKDIFAGCDTTKLKIRIGAEKYEEFAENNVWGKYKNCFEVVDVPEVVDFTDFGAQYSYSFENNSLKKQTYIGEHTIEHVHIIGQNGDLESQKGEVGLFNDIGIYNNYKLDYVKKKAFYGSETLKGISMFDLKGFGATGDAYTDLEVELQDSAFAYCPNLEYINMLYFRTDGTNSVEAMHPSRVQLGKGVFAGSDKFKVKMVTSAVEEFKADTTWAKYEDRFLPSFILTGDEALIAALEECGMEYESPITGGSFDIYDVMQVTDLSILNGKFQGKDITTFPDFKAFECVNLNYIGESWFKDCTKLQGIELPSTIDSIGKYAFYNCALLDNIVIPDSVKVVSDEAFRKCSNLRSITFKSEKPATLGTDVFADIPEDYVIYVADSVVNTYKEAWPQYADHIQSVGEKHTGIWEVTLTEPGTLAEKLGLTITDKNPLIIDGNYNKYEKLKISGPVNGTDIGVIRFMGGRDVNNCDVTHAGNLKYLDLYDADIKAGGEDYNQDGSNDRITEDNCIDTYMFWELDKLETLILPKSVIKIKNHAFNNCDALSRLVIGDNTKSIGAKVTHDCPQLKEVILLGNEAPATDKNAWSEDIPVGIFYTPNSIREHISGSRVYYTRGDSIGTPFEDDALLHALAEKRIYTMDDLTTLKSAENLINGNTEVKKFNELIMAVEITELGDNSFSGCTNLEEVMLPYKLETISAGAFNGCSSLMKVNVGCDSIPTLAENAFESLPEDFVIYVTVGKEDDYRKAWAQYADHIQGFKQLKEDVKVVTVTEAGTLGEALGFTVNMDSRNDVGRIGGDFISINALKVNGPINGKDIAVLRMLGGRDEEDCNEVILARMTYLDLYEATICTDPNNICFNRDGINDYVENDNEIPEHMFWKLDKLQTVILPKNVTKIDDNAFYDCLNIETIVVGDATTEIGNDAFGKCKNLKNIVFLSNEKPTLDDDAFSDPVSDQPYQVEKMYIPLSLYNKYVADREFTTHTKEFCTNYEEDALFRAYGSHAVMSDDQLRGVTNINGWFNHHNEVTDLTSLGVSSVDSISSTTFASIKGLKKITLPATLSVIEKDAFANNTKLQCVDFANCEKENVLAQSNISDLGLSQYALIYAPENFTATNLTNVVYGSKGDLKCDHLALSDSADYIVTREFKAAEISYDRVFEKGKASTLCLPFDMELPSGAKAYMLTEKDGDVLVFSQVKNIIANNPYIVVVDEDMSLSISTETLAPVTPKSLSLVEVDNFVMSGVLTSISENEAVAQSIYTLNDVACWNHVTTDENGKKAVYPYHAFIMATKPNMPSSLQVRFVDGTTGVDNVEMTNEQENDYIYDLHGRRVLELQNGNIYIVNGEKVMFK